VSMAIAIRTAIGCGAVALVGAVVAWFGASRRRQLAVIGLALPLMAFPMVSAGLMESVAADRSARSLAAEIEDHLGPETELLWIESYAAGVSFYLQRPIPVATTDGDELRSNYILRNAEIFLDDEGLLRPLAAAERAVSDCEGRRVFLLGTGSRDLGDVIEASGVPLLMETRRWLAFGPDCVRAKTAVVDETADDEEDVN